MSRKADAIVIIIYKDGSKTTVSDAHAVEFSYGSKIVEITSQSYTVTSTTDNIDKLIVVDVFLPEPVVITFDEHGNPVEN